MRFLQADGGEKIIRGEVINVDACALDGAGCAIAASGLDVKVLHQSYTGEEILSRGQSEGFSDAAEGFEAGIDAFERIGSFGSALGDGQIEQGVDGWAMFLDEAAQTFRQSLDTIGLQDQVRALELSNGSFYANAFVTGRKSLERRSQDRA